MTDTVDATDTHTGLTLLVWAFRAIQGVLIVLGGILFLGSLPMPGLQAMVVWLFVGLLWLLAVVVEFIGVRVVKGRA